MKRVSAGLIALIAAAVLLAVPASAAPSAPYSSSGITVSDNTPRAGSSVTVTVGGCRPNSPIAIAFDGGSAGSVNSDANGQGSSPVAIPSGVAAGSSHTLSTSCEQTSGETLNQSVPITIASSAPTTSSPLPLTGSSSAMMLAVGSLLLALGCATLLVSRRRTSRA